MSAVRPGATKRSPAVRRGFTLIELLVAIGLGMLVTGLVHRQLLHGRRVARAQLERMAMQDNVRVAASVLAGELGAVGADEVTPEASAALGIPAELRTDLRDLRPGAVTYLAARGAGFICSTELSSVEIVVAEATWNSSRSPRATDSLLVFVESDPTVATDDAWIHLGVISARSSSCPNGERALAIRVGLPAPLLAHVLSRITAGSPARLAEVMEARYYASGGKSWVGMRSVSTGEAITPIAGPFSDSTANARGLTLRYLDAGDAPTTDPAAVRAVTVSLLGITDQPIHGRDTRSALTDSMALATRVALREGPRP